MPSDDELRALLEPLMRRRTRFIAVPQPDGDATLATRFGGRAVGRRGEAWPRCTCGDPLRFVGQVSSADQERAWCRLAAFYYCWRCHRHGEQRCDGDGPWRGWCVRTYGDADLVLLDLPDLAYLGLPEDAFPEDEFLFRPGYVRAVRELSLPHGQTLTQVIPSTRALFDAIDGAERHALLVRVDLLAYEMTGRPGEGARRSSLPRNKGLAVGGWAYWYNGSDETPECPHCAATMELFLQLDVDPALAAGWGDVGTLFIFVCAEHRDCFGVRMQCT
jgi:hypothetical protein